MKSTLRELLQRAILAVAEDGSLPRVAAAKVPLERTRDSRHGDFTSNFAMVAARAAGTKPRELAQQVAARFPASDVVARVEVAGPGFINLYLRPGAQLAVIPDILARAGEYGRCNAGGGETVLLEFVSANPTGPLHIGHGRGAAYGATLGKLLSAAGYRVTHEYYVNDAGRQMDILALSIWLRYLELCGQKFPFPEGAYRGDYVRDIAARLLDAADRSLEVAAAELPLAERGGDVDEHLDRLIAAAGRRLGKGFDQARELGLSGILEDIRDDLSRFGVDFDVWFSERSLLESGRVDQCIEQLKTSGDIYEQEGALWFRSSAHGDEKDRVVVRSNGQKTYLAGDIAYHLDKFDRGFRRAINIWGADHHGHIGRVKAALKAFGRDPEALEVLLVQFATLYRGGQKVQMSTRSGEFVTLRELRDEVGNDAARFFYVTRKSEQHLDFDLDLAKSESSDNPVYYIQYAHARICSVLVQMREKGYEFTAPAVQDNLERLDQPHELALVSTLSRYPEVIEDAALARDPHLLAFYLRDLATEFHSYYNSHQFLVEDAGLRNARLGLVLAVRQVIRNGLEILGVSAPETM